MKFSISRETLLKNLRYMQSVVEKRTSIAILSNVRLTAKDNKLETTATDNDITVQGTAEAFVETDGVTTVNAHKFYEIINKTPEGLMVELEVSPEGNRMSIKAGKAKFSLACLSAEAFPDMTAIENGQTFDINGKDLKRALTKAIFAASTEDTRQYLNGIYMHHTTCKDGNPCLRFVATDGHRLSQVDLALPEGAEDITPTILPRKTVNELKTLCDENSVIRLTVSDKKVQAEAGCLTMTSKVVDGTFPDYTRVIPTDNTMEMDVSRRLLLQAVDRVAILSHEKSRSIKFTIDGANLLISANNPDQENAMEELKVEYDADKVDVGFNARYVADIGSQIEGDDIQFFFKDSASPVLVKDPKDTSSLFVVMPMRI